MSPTTPFRAALEWTIFAIAFLGFSSLAVTGEVGLGTLLFGYGLMALSRLRRRLPWVPSQRQWQYLSIFMFGVCVGQWRFITLDLLPAILLFTTHLQVVRLFELRTVRDAFQVLAIAFGMVLLASVLTTTPLFLPAAIAFGLASLLGLMLLTFQGEADRLGLAGDGPAQIAVRRQIDLALGRLMGRRFGMGVLAASLGLFALSAALFIMLPRYQGNDWLRSFRRAVQHVDQSASSGSGDSTVQLGDISRIRLDPTIVMRVSLPGLLGVGDLPPRDHLRLRGAAHHQFDGQRWELDALPSEFLAFSGIDYFASDVPDTLHQVIFQEAGSTPHLHWVTRLARFRLLGARAREIEASELGAWARLMGVTRLDEPITYEAWSDDTPSDMHPSLPERIPNFTPVVIEPGGDPDRVAEQMAELYRRSGSGSRWLIQRYVGSTEWTETSEPIRRIAVEWAAEAGCADPISIANEFCRRLRSPPFSYTLDPGRSLSDQPVAEFLTERQAGHCEYFASALVLLLRSVGVPARLVTGYHSDEWNSSGQFFVVREAHAHAWVEVFIPDGRGWLPWDPTPPVGLVAQMSGGRLLWFTHWLDARRHAWYRWVIDLGQPQQRELLNALGLPRLGGGFGLRGLMWRLRHFLRELDGGSLAAVGATLMMAGLSAALIGFSLMRRRAHARRRAQLRRAALFYQRMLLWLDRRGHRRPPGFTPAEFAARVAAARPEWTAAIAVTDLYYRARYAPEPLSETDQRRAEDLVLSLTG